VEESTIVANIVEARDQFALGNLEPGFARLADTLDLVQSEQTEIYCKQILGECSLRIREFGKDRLEYPILSVISLGACAK
jgi:hypothetical protein